MARNSLQLLTRLTPDQVVERLQPVVANGLFGQLQDKPLAGQMSSRKLSLLRNDGTNSFQPILKARLEEVGGGGTVLRGRFAVALGVKILTASWCGLWLAASVFVLFYLQVRSPGALFPVGMLAFGVLFWYLGMSSFQEDAMFIRDCLIEQLEATEGPS